MCHKCHISIFKNNNNMYMYIYSLSLSLAKSFVKFLGYHAKQSWSHSSQRSPARSEPRSAPLCVSATGRSGHQKPVAQPEHIRASIAWLECEWWGTKLTQAVHLVLADMSMCFIMSIVHKLKTILFHLWESSSPLPPVMPRTGHAVKANQKHFFPGHASQRHRHSIGTR